MNTSRLVVGTLFALAVSGCAVSPESRQRSALPATVEARQVWSGLAAPLTAGQVRLAGSLDRIDDGTRVFALGLDGGTLISGPTTPEHLSDDRFAVFVRLRDGRGWAYLDPRGLRLVPLDGSGGPDTSDLAPGTADSFSVIRAVAHRDGLFGVGQFDLVRCDFRVAGQDLAATGARRLTSGPEDESAPVVIQLGDHAEAVFVRTAPDGSTALHAVSLDGDRQREVGGSGRWSYRLPRVLDNGQLVAAVSEGGPWTIQLVDLNGGGPTPVVIAPPTPVGPEDLVLGMIASQGGWSPAVYRIPDRLDLPTTLALVEAHHPAINRRRALLAAALAEAARLKLAPLPTLSAGLFYTPVTSLITNGPGSPDVLAAGLARGVLGIAQPLLEWEATEALAQAGATRAEIARDLVEQEVNERLGEAAADWFALAALQRRNHADRLLADSTAERTSMQSTLAGLGEATRKQELAATRDAGEASSTLAVAGVEAERLRSRLRDACGLPRGARMNLDDRRVEAVGRGQLRLDELRRLAVLNHPEISAARRAIAVEAFSQVGNRENRPSLSAGADYGITADAHDGMALQDDYITLSLSGRLPLAYLFDQDIVARRDAAVAQARQLEATEVERRLAARIAELVVEERKAREALSQRGREQTLALEQVRVARLEDVYGPARPERAPGPDLRTAREILARSVRDVEDARGRLAAEEARLVSAVGLGRTLADRSAGPATTTGASIWVWRPTDLLADRPAMERFLDFAAGRNLAKVYLYLGAQAEIAAPGEPAERLALFTDRCAARGIAVWALIGEPEWLDADAGDGLAVACRGIERWNRDRGPLEPRLAGIKVDVEPRSDPRWQEAGGRAALVFRYLSLLAAVRAGVGDLPLWVDLPPAFFAAEGAGFIRQVEDAVDGATLMAYDARPDWIEARGREALTVWGKPLEIGLEFAPWAAANETLHGRVSGEQGIDELQHRLGQALSSSPRFAGIALHDWEALSGGPAPKPKTE
jgi:hypothetical protein